jgi:hypothetical protein
MGMVVNIWQSRSMHSIVRNLKRDERGQSHPVPFTDTHIFFYSIVFYIFYHNIVVLKIHGDIYKILTIYHI